LFFRAKCGSGFDDATLEKLQTELKPNMTKISKNPSQIPKWFSISRELVPDFIVIDPKISPVWEITVNILFHENYFLFVFFVWLGCRIF
jgi:ATP-dependent DNA ligase